MTPLLSITEKTIAVLLIAWGGIVLYTLISGISIITETSINSPFLNIELLKNFHPIFIFSIVTVCGGSLLLFNKKVGWIISITSLLLNIFFFLIPVEKGKNLFDDNISLLFYCGMSIVSLLSVHILVQPAFKDKYHATSKNWWTIASLTLLIMLDKTLLYLTS